MATLPEVQQVRQGKRARMMPGTTQETGCAAGYAGISRNNRHMQAIIVDGMGRQFRSACLEYIRENGHNRPTYTPLAIAALSWLHVTFFLEL
jgi:hypothetical protein